ncbi:MAG TPA: hypothetical protein VD838_11930 [Anaeromyxobacteraceae bacterium]|nr:hypothetical protein [Anaeromyxobacteraceae bacterium]
MNPGDKLGAWTALRRVDATTATGGRERWLWQCRCGAEHVHSVTYVRNLPAGSACNGCAGRFRRRDPRRRLWGKRAHALRSGDGEALEALDSELAELADEAGAVDELPDVI